MALWKQTNLAAKTWTELWLLLSAWMLKQIHALSIQALGLAFQRMGKDTFSARLLHGMLAGRCLSAILSRLSQTVPALGVLILGRIGEDKSGAAGMPWAPVQLC